MKKRVFAFLLVLLVLPMPVFAAAKADASELRILGDVDNNREVDYSDALLVLRASIGLETLDPDSLECADVDNSGSPDYADALLILKKSIQLIDAFPAELWTVTFDANGDAVSGLPAPAGGRWGEALTVPENPSREGYTFVGWYIDPACEQAFDFNTPITGSMTLYALWLEDKEPVPEETVPEETVPEETVPEETVPEETVPEETVPEEPVPEEPGPKVVDLTEKLDNLMHESAKTLKSVLAKQGRYRACIFYYHKVKDGDDWDIKLQDEWKFEEGTTYIYQGRVMRMDDPGNIHFGYLGAIILPEEIVCLGAGLNNISKFGFTAGDFKSYYDDPQDQEMMRWGYRLYKSGY